MRTRFVVPVALIAAGLSLPVAAQPSGAAKLTVEQSDKFGAYVAGSKDRPLYMFTADKQGKGSTKAKSSCYDACAEAWPPLLAESNPEVGEKLDPQLAGTIERKNGKAQATYGGWPLYYYVKDKGASSPTGQDVHGFGGEWYLVSPDGSKIEQGG